MKGLFAIPFMVAGVLFAVYIVRPAIYWLVDLILGAEHREEKRARAVQAELNRIAWEEDEERRLLEKTARQAEELEEAVALNRWHAENVRSKLNR